MTEAQALALFKCLGDKSRLQILKSLAQEDMYVERLAERLGLTPPTISFHLKKLSDAGAVRSYKTQYYTMYALNRGVFEQTMLSLILEESSEAQVQQQRDEAYRQRVEKAEPERRSSRSRRSRRRRTAAETAGETAE